MKILNNMVVEGRNVIATNVRKENNEIVADGIFNNYVDENGNCYRKTEYVVTEDGDSITIK